MRIYLILEKKLKKVKKTLDTYRENVVYLDIRFRKARRALIGD